MSGTTGAKHTISLNIPNFLTVLRILLVPLAVWLIISDLPAAAFAVMLVAGATDGIDGFIAKRYGWETELGAYLDPLADKLMLVSIYATLGIRALLPAWLVILVVSRDVLIVAGILLTVVIGEPVMMRPLMISKINTVAQIGLALLILANAGFGWRLHNPVTLGIYATAILTAASAAAYLWAWHRNGPPAKPKPSARKKDRQP